VLLETALGLPVLLLVAIGLVQFAIYYHAQNVVTLAVQDGARLAAAEDRSLAEGVAHAQALLQAGLGRTAREVTVQGSDAGAAVTLQAQGHLRAVIPWVTEVSFPLSGRASVSKEQFRAGPHG
jgi:Flp pilus assembly protein TadG